MIPTIFAPLATHLWQSTVFAAMAGLLTLALRRNRARVRYWLWLMASYKFLLPFAWLVSLGGLFEWRTAPPPVSLAVTQFTNTISRPMFLASFPAPSAMAQQASLLPIAIFAVWACGFAMVVAGWVRQWMRIRAIARAAAPSHLGLPIPVASTAARLEPGVFGIFRPVLLLPEGIANRLTKDQLQAVFAHELCHVRRRDNLAAAVHMLVEALFWFYPLVWWLGARMIDERERVCDEEVVQLGRDPQMYAESLLKVCEFYLESPLTCVSGVTGSDLKQRIKRIMRNDVGETLNGWRKTLLAIAGVFVLAAPLIVGMVRAQAPAAGSFEAMEAAGVKMSFDVASIKPSTSRSTSNVGGALDDTFVPTGGLFSMTSQLINLLRFAFKDMRLVGAPSWGMTDRFDIEARAPGNPTKDQYRLMLQSLLADRFKLTTHRETRQIPIYALVVAKEGNLGPHLKRDGEPCSTTAADIQTMATAPQVPQYSAPAASKAPQTPCGTILLVPPSAPGRVRAAGIKVPMSLLVSYFGPATGVDRPTFDRTGLSGTFDIDLEFSPVIPPGVPPPPGLTPDPDGPVFFQALQDQLGLKLEPQTGPVDVLVIDHVEKPTGN